MRSFYPGARFYFISIVALAMSFLTQAVTAQTSVVIGSGTDVSATTLYSPFYRFSAASSTTGSRANVVYTQAELAAAGVPNGAIITRVEFYKANVVSFTSASPFKILMANTSNTSLSTTLTWASVLSTHTEVYNTAAVSMPSAAGWVPWDIAPFTYTGGSLEVATEIQTVANSTTSNVQWQYTAGNADKIVGNTGAPATLNGTTTAYKNRPNIRITYTMPSACSGTPTPGTLAKSPTTPVCPGSSVALTVTGTSSGSGLTYELVSASSAAGPYSLAAGPQATSNFNVTPSATTWYRVRVACGAAADTTAPLEVVASPSAGSITRSPATAICAGGSVALNLTGGTTSGLTYQLVSSASNAGPYTAVGAYQATPAFNVTPASSTWYRIVAQCSGGATDTAAAVQIVVNPVMTAGNYTINSNLATGGNNFQSFTDAVAALKCGITGGVTFHVAPGSGPYNEQITIPQITGADASNRITFKGNLATIYASGASTGLRAVITLNGADYVTIDSLIIDTSGQLFGWGIHLTNQANYNVISNNDIRVSSTITTSNSHMGIVASNSATSGSSSGNNANYNLITGNTITGGYNSIILYGSSTAGAQNLNNVVSNNFIRDAYSHSMEFYYQSGAIISKNDISKSSRTNSTTTSGVFLGTATVNTLVEKNQIHNFFDVNTNPSTFYGLYSTADAKPGLENRFYNNLVYNIYGDATQYGIYNSGADSTKYYHNTIVLDDQTSPSGTTYGIYQSTSAKGIEFRNNNVVISRAGTGIKRAIIFGTAASIIVSNNNNLFINSTGGTNNFFGEDNGLTYETLTDWQNDNPNGYDLQSVSVDPLFVNPGGGDFTPTNAFMNNIGANLGVTTDIRDATRSTSPDPGAYEFSIPPCTTPIAGIVSPSALRVCAGNSISLDLINNSLGEGQTFQWQVSTDSLNWVNLGGPLAAPLFATTQSVTRYYRVAVTCGATTVYSAGKLVTTPGLLSGNFTINNGMASSATNFQTFEEAIDFIKCGINGPVVFDVAPSLYNEQIIIPVIPGASAVNTIKFFGHGATLAYAPTISGMRSAIRLEGADYITLDSFIIDVTGGTYGWGIHLTDTADHNTISNSTILTDISSTSSNYAGIVMSASPTSATTSGNSANFTTIKNNTINGGYYGIAAAGTTTTYTQNNTIDSNIITNQYYAGIYATNQENLVIRKNNISRPDRANTATTYYGIYTATASRNALVEANRIHNTHDMQTLQTGSVYGIYIDAATIAGSETMVINNLIYEVNNSLGPISGLRFGNGYIKAYHNTISLDNQSSKDTTTYGVYAENFAGIELKNNVISVTRTGTPAFNTTTKYKYGIYSAVVSTNVLVETNNDVYVTGPNAAFGYTGGSARNTLADWQSTGLGVNSNDKDPGFINPSAGDFTPTNPFLDNAGANVGVPKDILDVARVMTSPDMGAYEFSAAVDLIPPTITFTNLPYTCSTADRNLNGVQISDVGGLHTSGALVPRIYFRKGGTSTWFSNPGTLASGTAENGFWNFTISTSAIPGIAVGDSIQYFIIAQDSAGNVSSRPAAGLVATNVNTITSYPTNPAVYSIAVMSGVYTVGTGGNFTTLASAFTAYNNSCLAGPVTFSLISPTYTATGTMILNAHPDASATNTLTIKPATGVNATITGAVASGPIIRIRGNYVTIDGSNNGSGSRNLTISNTSTTSPSVIHIASTGITVQTNVTVKNSTIINGSTASTAVVIREVSNGYGFANNIVIDNNSIQKAYNGIYLVMESASGNGKGISITNNELTATGTNAIRLNGLYLYGLDSATVTGNKIGNFEKANGENDKGIWLERSTNTLVANNQIFNLGYTGTAAFAPYGIHNSLTSDKNMIAGNTVTGLTTSGTISPAGIYINGANTNTRIDGNTVNTISNTNTTGYGAYGIWLASTSSAANDTLVNNFVSNIIANGSPTPLNNGIGINVTAGAGYYIYNNTVRLHTNQLTAGISSALHISSGVSAAGAINLRNNILVNSQTTGTERYAIYSGSSNTIFAAINYNDYWSAGANLGYIISNRSNLAAIQAGFGGNANSINILPVFAGLDDLHIDPPTNLALNDKGIAIAGVTKDIDNETRAAVPDIGADEFTSTTGLDAGVLFQVLPGTKSCYTNAETVSVRVRNLSGSSRDLTTSPITVTASVTGPNPVTFTPVVVNTGTLAPGDSITVVISTNYDMSATGVYTFNASTAAGDANDVNNAMDATVVNVNAVAAGTISANRDNYCITGGTPTLTSNGAANFGSLQWEQSTSNSGPWTPVGTGATTYTPASAITSTMYYRLIATCGSNTSTSNIVTVLLEQPQVTGAVGATRCGPGTVTLTATGSAGTTLNWYDAPTGGVPVGTGNSFTTPSLTDTTTFYVAATTGTATYTVGPLNNSIGAVAVAGGYFMNFHVLTPVTIQTVDVYWSAAIGATYSIIIRDSASGATVSTHTGNTTVTGSSTPQTVNINSYLSPGVYQMGFATNPGTYRNSTGASYPYTAPGVLSITGNTFNNNAFYYYYYNWKIGSGCETARMPVVATVNDPVTISTDPAAQVVCPGANATFTVAANGSGTLTYQWRKNGVAIPGGTSATYSIPSVSLADSANYDVVVTGVCGADTSAVAKLTVTIPLAITAQPVAQAVCAGANATFNVTATGDGRTFQWRKNGTNITGATAASFTITGAAAADTASYDVVITNPCGSLTSSAVKLTISAATTITTQPLPVTICALNNATFTVVANGSGTLTYQWRKNGTAISGATNATFQVTTAAVSDSGNYDVVVTGTCGPVTSNAVKLTVNACTALPSIDTDVASAVLMPNVVRQNTVLRVILRRAAKMDWSITDAQGRNVMSFSRQMPSGQTDIQLTLEKLAAGTYYINGMTSKGRMETIRFVKL